MDFIQKPFQCSKKSKNGENMGIKSTIKKPRILIWLIVVLLCIIAIGPRINPEGVSVAYVQKNISAGLENLKAGDVIYKISGEKATLDLIGKPYYGIIKLETSRGTLTTRANGTLGIVCKNVPSSNLNFGLDIEGGVRAVIQPIEKIENVSTNTTIDDIISTLTTRINVYGLREATFRPMFYENKGFVEISMAGGNTEELKDLLERQGRFEARIPIAVTLVNGSGSITVDRVYQISSVNNTTKIIIDGQELNDDSDIILANISYHVKRYGNIINFSALAFSGDDVKVVYFDPQRSRVTAVTGGYEWMFQIQLSEEGANRFYRAVKNIPVYTDVSSGKRYLESKIELYLDDNLISSLSIASEFKDKPISDPSVQGYATTINEAKSEKIKLQSILRSGSLPTKIEIVQLETISPNLGYGFLKNAAIAGLAAMIAVSALVFARYRKWKIVLSMLLISFSEVIIILGVAVLIGWTIDLAAIAAIIIVIGTGVDAQIIITDEALVKGYDEQITLTEKIKRAFFIIFGSAGTTGVAMLALMFLGFGTLRGFAITTLIGILAAVLVTRPAFGELVKKIIE